LSFFSLPYWFNKSAVTIYTCDESGIKKVPMKYAVVINNIFCLFYSVTMCAVFVILRNIILLLNVKSIYLNKITLSTITLQSPRLKARKHFSYFHDQIVTCAKLVSTLKHKFILSIIIIIIIIIIIVNINLRYQCEFNVSI
jgi:hypothetical protein